ncbi:MAG: Crp/Fnr family transcriptional regulator [Candidatus Eremiobacteraeota bacterium]|nr:Crp/Fnr family transcriptional regulator [Candidatus Eremiobacteraeota bacterium]
MLGTKTTYLETLDPEAARAFQERLEFRRVAVGEELFSQGEMPTHLFLMKDIWAKVLVSTPGGREMVTEILFPGEFCGVVCGLSEQTYGASCVAMLDGQVGQIGWPDFMALCQKHGQLMPCGLATCCAKFRQQQEMMASLAVEKVRQRTARILLTIAGKLGDAQGGCIEFPLPFSRQVLSELIGTTVESTVRALSDMRKDGLVSEENGRMTLLRPDCIRQSLAVVGA